MRLAVLAVALLSTTPALAIEAITYKGTLGKYEIIAELAAPTHGALVGRYSYLHKGGDIPLDVAGRVGTPIMMVEEQPCTPTLCKQNEDGDVLNPPLGAMWSLTPSKDGNSLTGTWKPHGKGATLNVALEKVGQRTLPEGTEITPYGIRESVWDLYFVGDDQFTAANLPYEFTKQNVAFTQGEVQELEGSTYRYVIDPRTKFPFPQLISLADGSAVEAANTGLANRHALLNFLAFDCLSQVYAGFGANEYTSGMSVGTLGDYDNEQIELTYLTPTVLNWVESGSTYCTGAHPNNHSDTHIMDTTTGGDFPLSRVFKGWVATNNRDDYGADVDQAAARAKPDDYFWAADQELIDYAVANVEYSDDDDRYQAEQCELDDLIASNLTMRFAPGEQVTFTVEDLPNVVFACSRDLFTVALKDIPELLTPEAAQYFPGLAR